MNKEEIKNRIYRLRKERQLLETYLLNTGRQLPVWITSQYTYCKKGNCRCTKGHPHGPFHYLFFKEGEKIYHWYLPKEKMKEIEKWVNSYRTYNERLAMLNKINREIDTLLRRHQRENLLPIPRWIKKKKGRDRR
ncbi:MAG: DUF6788 family protein [Elusimicrobiales bacterium]